MSVLLLVNNTVFATSDLAKACLPNVSFLLYDPINDTYASLLEKIALLNISSFSEVGLVFDESVVASPTFTFLSSQLVPSILTDVEVADPTLSSWSEFSAFLEVLTTTYSMKTLDFFACALYSNLSWQYVFNILNYQLGIIIQSSTDMTGNITSGANWIMESNGVNIQDVYFNADISMYPFVFGVSGNIIFYKNGSYWGGGGNDGNANYIFGNVGANVVLNNLSLITGMISPTPTEFVPSYIINAVTVVPIVSNSSNTLKYLHYSSSHNLWNVNMMAGKTKKLLAGSNNVAGGFCMAWYTDGTISVMGTNNCYGEFGTGSNSNPTTPTLMSLPSGKTVYNIGAEYSASIVIFTDGTIYACGMNNSGQLGNGTTSSTYTNSLTAMTNLPAGLTPVQAFGGYGNTFIVFTDVSGNKSIYSCGNYNGLTRLTAINMAPIAGLNIISVCVSGFVTCVIMCSDNNGNLTIWGLGNLSGELGLGNTNWYGTLTQLTLPTGLIPLSICGEWGKTFITFTDNSLWFAGSNSGFYGIGASVLNVNYTSWTKLVTASSYPIMLSGQTIAFPPAITSIVSNIVSFTKDARNNASVIGYQYSVNGGTSWTELSSSITSFTITGLTVGTSYTLTMQAQNASSGWGFSSSQTFTAGVLPTAPIISNAVGTTVYVTPYVDLSITNYRYKYTTDSTWATDVVTGTSITIPFALDMLTLGTVYYIQTQAYNSLGWGPYSTVYSFTALAIPSSPVITSITNGNMQVSIAFTVGPSSTAATSYTYNYSTDSGVTWPASPVTASQTSSPIIVTGLTVGSTYTLKIFAVSAAGSSPSSNILASSVIYTTPSTPTITSIVPGNTTAVLTFTAGSTNYSAITSYRYSYITSTNNGVTWGSTWSTPYATASGTTSPITITGLTAGTGYQFNLYAENVAGLSTAAVSPTVQASSPLAPTITAATGGSSSASVNFTAPTSNNGSAITSYVYLYATSTNGGDAWSSWSTTPLPAVAGTTSPLTITGLTPPSTTPEGVTTTTVYQFKLAAVNANGTGSFSVAYGTVTPYGPPAAPIITSIVGGNAQCAIYITYPGNNGANITTINYSYSVNGGSWSNFVNLGNNSASSLYTFSYLNGGSNYSVMIQAVNSAGASTNSNAMSVIISAPGAPTSLTATSTGVGTASISFTAGPSNGFQPSNMVYQYSSDSGTTWSSLITRSPASVESPLVVTGLVSSTSYIFKLATINSAGTGQLSVASNPITTPSAPAVPTITSVSAGSGTGQVSVAFTAPSSDGGSAITNYKYSIDSGATFTSAGTTASPIVISGLTNGTAYTVIMKAVNAAGESEASTASGSVTPYTNPGAPTSLFVSGTGISGQVSVAFTAPSSDGGSAIINYKYSIDSGATFTSAGTTASPIVISGLTNGTAYTVIMKAVNAAGESEASTASGSVTPYTNPDAPTSLIASASNAQISVAYSAGAGNGSEIIDYLYSIDGGATFTSSAQTSNPLIIAGLTNGTLYTVYLKAMNLAGTSNSSPASNSVTPQIRPTLDPRYTIAPPAPTLSASGLIISVTAGMYNGSITTNYQWSADNSTWISMSPTQTITPFTLIPSGLIAGSDYTIYIRAINVGFVNGSGASISISVPSPTYVAQVVTIPDVEITAGSIGTTVTTVTASLGTTLTAGALANSNVSSVDLSAATNITSIPEGTFSGSALTSIMLPETITSIGSNAFAGCPLETISIPESVTTISSNAFAGCPLETISIPASVTIIGAGALQGTSLTSISLSSGAAIGEYAFANCVNMTQVSF